MQPVLHFKNGTTYCDSIHKFLYVVAVPEGARVCGEPGDCLATLGQESGARGRSQAQWRQELEYEPTETQRENVEQFSNIIYYDNITIYGYTRIFGIFLF